MVIEEAVRAIEYVRCRGCMGDGVLADWGDRCGHCDGWGYVVDPPVLSERTKIGLAGVFGATIEIIVVEIPFPPAVVKLRQRLRQPRRKHRDSRGSG